MVRDRFLGSWFKNIKIKLVAKDDTNCTVYNFPISSKIFMLVVGDVDTFIDKRDYYLDENYIVKTC